MTVINDPLRMSTSAPSLFFLLCNKLGEGGGGEGGPLHNQCTAARNRWKKVAHAEKGIIYHPPWGTGWEGRGYKKGHTTAAAGAWYPFLKGEERRGEGGRAG